ncbi:uncharacterized protein LOC144640295 [Oculina patagonica]
MIILHFIRQLGNKSLAFGNKNNTKELCDQDGTGIRRCSVYALNDPYQECYTQYFVGGQPPVGLRTGNRNLRNVRYICQPPAVNNQRPLEHYYATMFDEGYGIAVFSAYVLTQLTSVFQQQYRQEWYPTPGIINQGSKAIYRNQRYHRGHLVPAETLSSSQERWDSTYTYTNGVPQRPAFNTGMWYKFESRIRRYARETCKRLHQGQPAGTLFLLTGTSLARIQQQENNPPQPNVNVPVNRLHHPTDPFVKIAIPNSLWTAGCCVRPDGDARSFAVIGNNVQDVDSRTQQVTVAQLQDFLGADVNHRHIGEPDVRLFPGNPACSNVNNDVNLPQAQ